MWQYTRSSLNCAILAASDVTWLTSSVDLAFRSYDREAVGCTEILHALHGDQSFADHTLDRRA